MPSRRPAFAASSTGQSALDVAKWDAACVLLLVWCIQWQADTYLV